MRIIFNLLFGKVDEQSLSDRIYTIITFGLGIISTLMSIVTLLFAREQTNLFIELGTLLLSFSFIVYYYFARFKKRYFYFLFFALMLVQNTLLFIVFGGLQSSALYLFVPLFIIMMAIVDKKHYFIISLTIVLNIAFLYLVNPYITIISNPLIESRGIINELLFPLVIFSSGFIILVLRLNYSEKNNLLETKNDEITELYKSVTDSVKYATKIQQALLPSNDRMQTFMPENFILFLPRDLVSGDYYWAAHVDDKIVIIAADCTGHGVPGAFMSMLGISMLNELVINKKILEPDVVLEHMRSQIKSNFDGGAQDAMDMAMVVIDEQNMKLNYAGAYSPLMQIRNNELHEFKGNRQPVGNYLKETPFISVTIELEKGDTYYMASDGYKDQIGGQKGAKYLSKNFKKLLLSIHSKPMTEQKQIMLETFDNWKNYVKTDNISIKNINEYLASADISEETRTLVKDKMMQFRKEVKLDKDISFKELSSLYKGKMRDELIELYVSLVQKNNNQIDDVLVMGFRI